VRGQATAAVEKPKAQKTTPKPRPSAIRFIILISCGVIAMGLRVNAENFHLASTMWQINVTKLAYGILPKYRRFQHNHRVLHPLRS